MRLNATPPPTVITDASAAHAAALRDNALLGTIDRADATLGKVPPVLDSLDAGTPRGVGTVSASLRSAGETMADAAGDAARAGHAELTGAFGLQGAQLVHDAPMFAVKPGARTWPASDAGALASAARETVDAGRKTLADARSVIKTGKLPTSELTPPPTDADGPAAPQPTDDAPQPAGATAPDAADGGDGGGLALPPELLTALLAGGAKHGDQAASGAAAPAAPRKLPFGFRPNGESKEPVAAKAPAGTPPSQDASGDLGGLLAALGAGGAGGAGGEAPAEEAPKPHRLPFGFRPNRENTDPGPLPFGFQPNAKPKPATRQE